MEGYKKASTEHRYYCTLWMHYGPEDIFPALFMWLVIFTLTGGGKIFFTVCCAGIRCTSMLYMFTDSIVQLFNLMCNGLILIVWQR